MKTQNNNTPPPWEEAPDWAMWRAQDANGAWFWFRKKPTQENDSFDSDGRILMCRYTEPNPNWKSTLEKRPEQ